MAGKDISAAGAAITADSTNAGVITIGSTTPFRAKAICWLSGTALASQKCIITEVTDATHLKVRLLPDQVTIGTGSPLTGGTVRNLGDFAPKYTNSDVSLYTLAANSRIDMDRQLIYDEPR
jgi:hypothetical protein